jgi:hypothetical protein
MLNKLYAFTNSILCVFILQALIDSFTHNLDGKQPVKLNSSNRNNLLPRKNLSYMNNYFEWG